MKDFVVIPNTNKDRDLRVTDSVVERLISYGFSVYVHEDTGYSREGVITYSEFPEHIDLMIVVGGDGSVIDASGIAIDRDIPILGVNLGRLGYLTEVELEDLDILGRLVNDDFCITEKMLLCVDFGNDKPRCERYAVNDVTIARESFLHIADIKIEDSIGNVVRLRADGVILSTPQGSTAYSFSAGGPIVSHDVESILLTPISPHSMFNRSVLFNSSDVIKVTNTGELSLNLSMDGRCVAELAPGDFCRIMKASRTVRMLTFKKNSMFSNLFKKMRILGDIEK